MSTIPRFSPANLLGFPLALLKPARMRRHEAKVEPTLTTMRIGGTYPRPPQEDMPGGVDMAKLLAAVKSSPQLPLMEWDGDRALPLPDFAPEAPSAGEDSEDPRHLDARRRKIRDRYVSARFPGVARSGADLQGAARIIKAARLYFEEDDVDTAVELLQLAIEEAPQESALWLARLELLFLARDAQGFTQAARAFSSTHPDHESWAEVARLGRALAPDETLFGGTSGPREHEHYGPWPHLPNWIQAPWDLTGEIVAADFHRAMSRSLPRAAQ